MKRLTTFTFGIVIWAATNPYAVSVAQGPTMSNVVYVSSATELMSALSKAKGGETILLNSGNYGDLSLIDKRHPFSNYADTVTIKSADLDNKATFSSFTLAGVDNLTFDSINFDYTAAPGAVEYHKPFQIIRGSTNIEIKNSVFDGDLASGSSDTANGYGTGFGLNVAGASNIKVDGNVFYNWHRAAVFGGVEGLVVSNNEIHSVRSDGLNFIDVDNVLIEANYLHDFAAATGSGDHRDMIQFWTNGTKSPSTNVVIRGNILDSGSGAETQSIFMRNEEVDTGRQGDAMFYRNIVIEDNVIYNAHTHGVTVGETHGLIIRNNTILQNKAAVGDALVYVPTINIKNASTDVVVANNIVPRLSLQSTANATVTNNLVVQRDFPDAENYYGTLFVNALADGRATLADLMALPSGLIEQMGVGSSLTAFSKTPGAPIGFISNEPGSGLSLHQHAFDASNLYGPNGKIDIGNASVTWDFGDGASAKGVNPTHSFGQAGNYAVTATVALSNGSTLTLSKVIRVDSPVAISSNFDNGAKDLSDVENGAAVGQTVTFEDGLDGKAARLNGGKVTYARNSELFNNSEYTLLVDFKKDAGSEASSGRLIYFAGSFVIAVQANGVHATVSTDKGGGTIKADNIGLKDADWHQLALTFSGKQGTATLYIDGVAVGSLNGLDGHIQKGNSSHDFHVGDLTGQQSFTGLIDNVSFVRGALTTEQVASYYKSPWDFHPDSLPPEEAPPVPVPPSNDRGDLDHYPRVLAANFEVDAKDLTELENAVTVGKSVTFESCDGGQAIRLNGGAVTYGRNPELFDNSEYTLLFDFKKDPGAEGVGGRIINFSYSFVLTVEADGISASLTTDKGGGLIKAKYIGIKDADWHQVALTFSGEDGEAVLYVDGAEVGRLEGLEGHIQKGNLSHSLHVGDPFGGRSFTGLVDNLVFLQGAMTPEEVQANCETPYDFCQPAMVADAVENLSLAPSSDASGSSSTFIAPADSLDKTAAPADGPTAAKVTAAPASGATSTGVSAAASAAFANDILVTSYSAPAQPGGDTFAFTPSLSGSDASDELLTWNPDSGEVAPIASDIGLAEELTQIYEAQSPELLLL